MRQFKRKKGYTVIGIHLGDPVYMARGWRNYSFLWRGMAFKTTAQMEHYSKQFGCHVNPDGYL